MQNRAAAAFTWHHLATLDVNEGRYRDAWSKFCMALSIQQELGDIGREAVTFANLAALAAEIGRGEMALRLYIVSVLLMRDLDHPHLEEVEEAANSLARQLDYDEIEFSELVEDTINTYWIDYGWTLIEEAFEGAFWGNWE